MVLRIGESLFAAYVNISHTEAFSLLYSDKFVYYSYFYFYCSYVGNVCFACYEVDLLIAVRSACVIAACDPYHFDKCCL